MAEAEQDTMAGEQPTIAASSNEVANSSSVSDELQARRREVLERHEKELEAIGTKAEQRLEVINTLDQQARGLVTSLTEGIAQAKTITGQVEKSAANSQKVEAKLVELEKKAESFVDMVQGADGKPGLLKEMEGAAAKLKEAAASFEAQRNDLASFHADVMGDAERQKKGARQEFEEVRKQYVADQAQQAENFKALYDRIEGLLPGATSAGLASASKNQRSAYRRPILISAGIAVGTLVAMIGYGMKTAEPTADWSGALLHLISHVHIYGPGIWLVIIALRKLNQYNRLEQEYAHKETLANTYVGFSREVEKLPESDASKALREELLKSAIASSSYNPSSTLDGAEHNERPPVLDKIAGAIPKAGK